PQPLAPHSSPPPRHPHPPSTPGPPPAPPQAPGPPQLAAITARLTGQGFTIGGDRLASRPRGVPADHPRLDLLRHRRIDAGRRLGPGPALRSARAADFVRRTWEQVRPLLDWAEARGITPRPPQRGADPTP
ncbi:DUF2461 family protein, partial [Streptomyces sp. NPDC001920]